MFFASGRKMNQIMLICLMATMSRGSSTMGDARSIVDNRLKSLAEEESENEDAVSPIKKAYTYVSEYKRLPVFNFGIGKRWTDVNGIKGAQPYSFGFGKRSQSPSYYPARMGLAYMPYDSNEDEMSDEVLTASLGGRTKRAGRLRPYSFGLGKRSLPSRYETKNLALNRDEVEEPRQHLRDEMGQRFLYELGNGLIVNDRDDPRQED